MGEFNAYCLAKILFIIFSTKVSNWIVWNWIILKYCFVNLFPSFNSLVKLCLINYKLKLSQNTRIFQQWVMTLSLNNMSSSYKDASVLASNLSNKPLIWNLNWFLPTSPEHNETKWCFLQLFLNLTTTCVVHPSNSSMPCSGMNFDCSVWSPLQWNCFCSNNPSDHLLRINPVLT